MPPTSRYEAVASHSRRLSDRYFEAMQKHTSLVFAAVMLAVIACAGCTNLDKAPTASVAPSPDAPANTEACATFGEVTVDVGNAVVADGLSIDIPAEFDRALLIAESEVQTRIRTLVDNLPEPPHMIAWMDNRDAYNADVEAVARACAAEGADVGQYATLTAGG